MKSFTTKRLATRRQSRRLMAWESLEERRLLSVAAATNGQLAAPDLPSETGTEHVIFDSERMEEDRIKWGIDQAVEGMIAMDVDADRVMESAPGIVPVDTVLADIEVEVKAAMGCAMALEIIESPLSVRSQPVSSDTSPMEESERAASAQPLTPMETAVVTISTLALSCGGPKILKNAGHRLDHQKAAIAHRSRKKVDP